MCDNKCNHNCNKNRLNRQVIMDKEGREDFFDDDYVENLVKTNYKKKKIVWNKKKSLPDLAGFIMVYATWCETCHGMRDWFSELSIWWENDFYFGGINTMDVEAGNDKFGLLVGVDSFPSFFSVTGDGKLSKYYGDLNREEIYEWMSIFREEILENRPFV